MKKDLNISNFSSLLHPFQGTLLTIKGPSNQDNIIAIAWIMPVSNSPPALIFAIRKERYSFGLLQESKAFVVNIPTIDLIDSVFFSGTKSGKFFDKFKETGLTKGHAKVLDVPIIEECIGQIECTVREIVDIGLDHVLVIGNVFACYAEDHYFDKKWRTEKVKLLLHLGGDSFTTNTKKIYRPKV